MGPVDRREEHRRLYERPPAKKESETTTALMVWGLVAFGGLLLAFGLTVDGDSGSARLKVMAALCALCFLGLVGYALYSRTGWRTPSEGGWRWFRAVAGGALLASGVAILTLADSVDPAVGWFLVLFGISAVTAAAVGWKLETRGDG